MAKTVVRSIYSEAAATEDTQKRASIAEWAKRSEHGNRRTALLRLAQSERPIAIAPTDLDCDGWAFNTLTATINLRDGTQRAHDPKDLITKLSPVAFDPSAPCPTYDGFIDHIFAGDMTLIEYIERLIGYWLTADIRHHHLPIGWGGGANGKSTLFDLLLFIMGDYAAPAPDSLMMQRTGDEHPTEIADCYGRRLLIATENDEGKKLRSGSVKKMTGDAMLKGRFMRCDYFSFQRTHKLLLVTNNRPRVSEDSTAIWRRLRLIPFTITIPDHEQDRTLPEKLRAEAPGILARWIQACLRWQAAGFDLAEPPRVTEATEDYKDAENVLADFIASDCIIGEAERATRSDIWQAYKRWTEREDVPYPLGQHNFYERIGRIPGVTEGYIMTHRSQRGFKGIGVALGGLNHV